MLYRILELERGFACVYVNRVRNFFYKFCPLKIRHEKKKKENTNIIAKIKCHFAASQ